MVQAEKHEKFVIVEKAVHLNQSFDHNRDGSKAKKHLDACRAGLTCMEYAYNDKRVGMTEKFENIGHLVKAYNLTFKYFAQ